MSDNNAVIAVYPSHVQAEEAVRRLQRAGFDLKAISIVGKGYHTEENVTGYYNIGDRMKYWGKLGAFWGGFWGILFGTGAFFIPGIGPLVVAGPVVGMIVGALENAAVVGGVSVLGAALFSAGIPKDSVLKYETAIKSDNFLLLVNGSADTVKRAKEVLDKTAPNATTLHVT